MKTIPRLVAVWLMLLIAIGTLRALRPGYGEVTLLDAMGHPFVAPDSNLIATSTALAFVLLGAWLSGKVFKILHLPRITGYLAFGVLVGPSLISLISESTPPLLSRPQMEHLRLFSSLAIALIGLTAGGEIKIELLRRGFGRVLTITSIEMIAVFGSVLLVLFAGRPLIAFLSDLRQAEAVVACTLLAVVAISNSPAVVVAMLSETRATGPMAETSLAVTVCKDLFVVVLFTLASGIGYGLVRASDGGGLQASLVSDLAWHLLGSIAAGALLGAAMSPLLERLGRHMPVFVLATALGIVLISESLRFEPLLVAISAGFLLSNTWPRRSAELFHSVDELSLPVYCIFFAMAGAKIDLASLLTLWPLALALVAVRVLAIYCGTTIAARVAGVPAPARTWLWTAFIPQAGISIALATQIGILFAEFEWGPMLSSLRLAKIALLECFGPILLRLGLIKAGEATG